MVSLARSRPYEMRQDLEKLKGFFTTARQIAGHVAGYLHAGDVMWRLALNDIDLERDIRFWEDEALGIVGVACLFTLEDFEFHLHPKLPDEQFFDIAEEVLQWAEQRYLEQVTEADNEETEGLLTQAAETNQRMKIALEQAGFQPDEFEQFIYLLDLNQTIPDVALPPGYTVRQVLPQEFAERISIHQEVWESDYLTGDRYDRVRAIPGFIPELDLVVVTPEGKFAAYCIVWLVDGVGEFEPVGTRPMYLKQGFGKAVIFEGLKRLKAMGAHTATVYSKPQNRLFYESCGFEVVNRWLGYIKNPLL